MERQRQISEWIGRMSPDVAFSLTPASADASFRRYLRATFDDGTTRVVMDAPPSHEDVKPWLHVQRLFHAQRKLWNARSLPIPIRAWHPGSIEEDLLEEYIRIAFDRATFGEMAHIAASGTRGRFTSADGTLDYARTWEETDVPTLIVAGTRDLLAPEDSVRPAYERSRAQDKTFHAFPLGHADLLIGRDAPRMTWPTVSSWIARRCDATTRPRSRAA